MVAGALEKGQVLDLFDAQLPVSGLSQDCQGLQTHMYYSAVTVRFFSSSLDHSFVCKS